MRRIRHGLVLAVVIAACAPARVSEIDDVHSTTGMREVVPIDDPQALVVAPD